MSEMSNQRWLDIHKSYQEYCRKEGEKGKVILPLRVLMIYEGCSEILAKELGISNAEFLEYYFSSRRKFPI